MQREWLALTRKSRSGGGRQLLPLPFPVLAVGAPLGRLLGCSPRLPLLDGAAPWPLAAPAASSRRWLCVVCFEMPRGSAQGSSHAAVAANTSGRAPTAGGAHSRLVRRCTSGRFRQMLVRTVPGSAAQACLRAENMAQRLLT